MDGLSERGMDAFNLSSFMMREGFAVMSDMYDEDRNPEVRACTIIDTIRSRESIDLGGINR
jgi:hypothetical protein